MDFVSVDKMPSKEFLDDLSRLTAENNHGLVYSKIAAWCYVNAKCDNGKESFKMLLKIFRTMNETHKKLGEFPFGVLRFQVGCDMDALIKRVFGQKCLDAINSAC